MKKHIIVLGICIALVFLLTSRAEAQPFGTPGSSYSLWKYVNSILQPVMGSWTVELPSGLSGTTLTGDTLYVRGLDCSGNTNDGAVTAGADGKLVCSDDDGGGGASSGLTGTGNPLDLAYYTTSGTLSGAGILRTGEGTLSGVILHADAKLSSSGQLVVQGTMSGGSTVTFSSLVSCDTIDTDANGVLSCGTDADTDTDTTYTAGEGLSLDGTVFSRIATITGTSIDLSGSMSGDTLLFQSQGTGSELWVTSIAASCEDVETDASGKLICGTDATGASEGAWSGTGALQAAFDERYVNQSGDTMTGDLVLQGKTLTATGVYSTGTLSASGALFVETTSSLQGNVTVGGTAALQGVTVATTLAVTGAATFASTVNITGQLSVTGALSVDGTLYAQGGVTGALTGNADTATALAANGANCGAGEIPLGVDASGAVESCYEPAEADISDLAHTATAITDDLIVMADLNQDSEPSDGDVLTYDSTGANFEWITPNAGTDITADLEEEVTEGSLADSTIVSADIKDGTIAVADIASADFGDWTCNGSTCDLDASVVDLTANVTGILPLANGGTNSNLSASSGAIVISSVDDLQLTGVSSTGNILIGQGTKTPIWGNDVRTLIWVIPSGIATGTGNTTPVIMPFGMTLTEVQLTINESPITTDLEMNITEDGSNIFSTAPEIDAGTNNDDNNEVFSDTDLDKGDRIHLSVTQVGSGGAGTGLTVLLTGNRHP